jgi:peroxiredoxin
MIKTKFTPLLFALLALGACGKPADKPKDAKLDKAIAEAQKDSEDTLKVGQKAPDFSAAGALAGKDFKFKLSEKLKEGPLVLYFFPKAFTPGCTLEAHDFSDTTEEFKKYGATVIGMSGDNIDALKKFSTEECRDKFAVATATPEIAKAFHVDMMQGITKRTTFVIAQDGTISMIYENSDYRNHVTNALEQVKELAKLK